VWNIAIKSIKTWLKTNNKYMWPTQRWFHMVSCGLIMKTLDVTTKKHGSTTHAYTVIYIYIHIHTYTYIYPYIIHQCPSHFSNLHSLPFPASTWPMMGPQPGGGPQSRLRPTPRFHHTQTVLGCRGKVGGSNATKGGEGAASSGTVGVLFLDIPSGKLT